MADAPRPDRIDWIDHAKGLCILLVVGFHAANHYEAAVAAEGWMRAVIDFSKPFRMPDFFLVSGLFLGRTINAPLRDFLDRKVLHFAWFYLVWLAIWLVATEPQLLMRDQLAWAGRIVETTLQPVGTLWFIHMLALFHIAARLLRRAPPTLIIVGAAALQLLSSTGLAETPSFAVNRFCEYFIFFCIGWLCSPHVFRLAGAAARRPVRATVALFLWAIIHGGLVAAGAHHLPMLALVISLAGAIAVTGFAAVASTTVTLGWLASLGRHSLAIYLGFMFPLTVLERLLAEHQIIPDVGAATLAIVIASVAAALIAEQVTLRTPLKLLYRRPSWARLRRRTDISATTASNRKAGAVQGAPEPLGAR